MIRLTGGAGENADLNGAQAVGDVRTVVGAWEAARIRISVDGVAFTNAVNSSIPALAAANVDIGSFAGGSHGDGNYLWVLTGKGTLTDADAARINSWGYAVPTLGQIAMLSYASKPTLLIPAKTGDAVLLPAYFEGAY